MKSFTKLIGKLPFAGKMPIRRFVFNLYQSATPTRRRWSYLEITLLLVFFVLVHATQAELGIRGLGFSSPIWAKVVYGLYAIVNILAVMAQIYLGFRMTRFFLKKKQFYRKKKRYTFFSDAEALTMLATTFGGQIIFISLYFWYRP